MNGTQHAHLTGTYGILEAYRKAFADGLKLYGPTYFETILKFMIDQVEAKGDSNEYSVFLILTDGVIHDMAQTKTQII